MALGRSNSFKLQQSTRLQGSQRLSMEQAQTLCTNEMSESLVRTKLWKHSVAAYLSCSQLVQEECASILSFSGLRWELENGFCNRMPLSLFLSTPLSLISLSHGKIMLFCMMRGGNGSGVGLAKFRLGPVDLNCQFKPSASMRMGFIWFKMLTT